MDLVRHGRKENLRVFMLHLTDIPGHKIYVVNSRTKDSIEREKRLDNLLGKQYSLNYEFVAESADAYENEKKIKEFFVPDVYSILTKGALYCELIHFLIYERFLKSNYPFAIVFENDVFFLDKFDEDIRPILKEAETLQSGFIISLENSTLKFPSWRITKKGKHLYEALAGRCTGAYVADRKAAEVILNDLKNNKCFLPIDWWHNNLVNRKIIKMYWAHPAITEQGSFNGKFYSTISSHRIDGKFRRAKWLTEKFYKTYLLRWFK